MMKYFILLLTFFYSLNVYSIEVNDSDQISRTKVNYKIDRKDNIKPYIKDYNNKNDTQYDLNEILDHKIHQNSYNADFPNNKHQIKVFMNPNDQGANVLPNMATLSYNRVMKEQIGKLNKYQNVEYGPHQIKKNYVYGLGISIPLENNN